MLKTILSISKNIKLEYSKIFNQSTTTTIEINMDVYKMLKSKEAFSDKDLTGCDFRMLNLERVNFIGSNLKKANFEGANLKFSNFQGADLRGANFTDTDLSCSDFRDAKLEGADFGGAIVTGCRFRARKPIKDN
jgi:uncharacterized protein YjbI with pentapeptide repeats